MIWRIVALGVAIAAASIPASARAEPVRLVCEGAVRAIVEGRVVPPAKDVRVLTIDLSAKTVTVEGYDTVPIMGEPDDMVVFMADRRQAFGVSTGTVNRVSGAASIHIISDGLIIFEGICKPAQKLF
jgi:hypothetical protein